jgi:glycosyltransferase 2 family protein
MAMAMAMVSMWRRLPLGLRRLLGVGLKAVITLGAFYLLLNHRIDAGDGTHLSIWQAIRGQLATLTLAKLLPLLAIAAGIKFIGIFASMVRWHLLLVGQGIRFPLWHVVGSFLIGRFLGTFLPSTVGLDGYKLYDASRFSGRVVEPAAATVLEKVMGLAGMLLCFVVTFPFGYTILGGAALAVAILTIPAAVGLIGALVWLLLHAPRGATVTASSSEAPRGWRQRAAHLLGRLRAAALAYRGKGGLLAGVLALSFLVHFCTAAMYYFTALAVGAASPSFGAVAFASTIQIFATVMSPLTIAGEGVREIVQALLLAKHIGASQSVLSAAFGFWAAEALTLCGAFFLWGRSASYRPRLTLAPASDGAAGS